MSNVYLVGGLTPRTDLDNYQTAFLSKEKAEESKAYWNSFHEDNDYDEYHIDSIEIEDLEEHDKQVRNEVIDRIKKSVKNALDSYNPSYMDIYNVISELSDVVIGRIEIFKEQLKGTET